MTNRWLAGAALLLGTLVGGLAAGAAYATNPVDLGSGRVLDRAGVLTSSELDAAETRIAELTQASDLDLFVVFVDEFSNPDVAPQWADTVADRNGMGDRDYLLAVAVEQRTYAFSASVDGPISASQQDSIQRAVEQRLAQDDWAGAIDAAADEMQGDGGVGMLVFLGVVVAIAVVALVIWLIVRARRRAEVRARGAMPEKPDPNDPFSTLTDEQVEAQAGSAIVRADDAITSSREELGFAIAQFGEEATSAFSAAMDTAKAKMSEAFDLKQKLDDEIPDTVFDRRAWHIRIIGLCDEIDDVLDANTEEFDELRGLADNAPRELERVRGERAALQPALDAADSAVSGLTATYDAAALSTVSANPAQARERAALADRSIEAAAKAVAEDDRGSAAFAIRTAEQSVAQAGQLIGAITELGGQLAELEAQAQSLVAELQNDIAAARQLPDARGELSAAVSAASAELQRAQANLSGSARSPRRVLEALTAANAQIDAAVAQGRQQAERLQRATRLLDQTIAQADAEIRATRSFIETRRGGIGSTARTRLAQAEQALSHAVATASSDPVAAHTAAERALQLAHLAGASAQADIEAASQARFPIPGGDVGGGLFGSAGGSGLAGDILGGILGGLIAGGGGGSSRRSGGGWRSSGGGFRASGFGGGGRAGGGRRSGGGRF